MMSFLRSFRYVQKIAHDFSPSSIVRNIEQYLIPSLQLAGAPQIKRSDGNHIEALLDWVILLAAPKSKVSPSRKRQKHLAYYPDKVAWIRCNKCGEAKRPHRICTEHLDVCAMRDDEYEQHLKSKASNPNP
jgi:ribosomal protein L32